MDQVHPRLPVVFELTALGRVDSVLEEAARRADRGAGEGTVIWAREQINAVTRGGKSWYSPSGNLHCAVIIEPEFDKVTAEQLLYVAAVSAGTAIADLLTPMTGLRYRWPNHVYINDLKSGMLQLRGARGGEVGYRWLAIGLFVNVSEHPSNPEPERYNSIHASGARDVAAETLLEAYCRYFLSWINRWADEGFAPVRKAWVQRADGLGENFYREVGAEKIEGVLRTPDEEGRGVVEVADGRERKLSLGEYFGTGGTDEPDPEKRRGDR